MIRQGVKTIGEVRTLHRMFDCQVINALQDQLLAARSPAPDPPTEEGQRRP